VSRLAVSIIFFASLAVGFAVWLVIDRLFVRPQNRLLSRFDKTDAIEAAVIIENGGWLATLLRPVKLALASWFGGVGLSKTQRDQLFELPDLIDLLAIAMSSGESLYSSLARVASRASGIVATDLHRVLLGVQLGGSLSAELVAWGVRANSRQVLELCTKLQLAMQRGTPLVEMLTDQAAALRAEVHQVITKKAGQNETRMLVPLIFLILPVTVLFAIYPSLQVLSITG
jgi:tight adherence protein C